VTGAPARTTIAGPSRPRAGAAAEWRATAPRAAGLVAVGIFAWWAVADGGVAPTTWYPGALALLAALAVAAVAGGGRARPATARWALWALATSVLWTFASLSWSGARGEAWDAANRALLSLIVFALFAAVPWRPRDAAGVLGAFVLATTAAGIWALASAISGSDPTAFDGWRLAGPVGYENASAALFLAAFWPALLLAARRSLPAVVRGGLLASAGVLLQLVVLAQSRGAVLAGAAGLVLALLLHRDRARLLACLAAVAVTTAASLPALVNAYGTGMAPSAEHDALLAVAAAIAISAAVLFTAGVAAGRRNGRNGSPGVRRAALHWLAAVLVLAVAVGLWASAPDSRLSAGTATGRYDFWRVAAQQLAEHPLTGSGAGSFAQDYARERRQLEEPLYPHSMIAASLGQTGLVGAALLAGFFLAAFGGLRRLDGDDARWAVGLAAVVSAAVWLAQASVDWLWELPALAGPAMACLGLVAGLAARSPGVARRPRPAVVAAAVAAGGAAAASFALPALSAREVEAAVRDRASDPGAALARLDRARRLNPLSDRPDVIAGTLALRAGAREAARHAFSRAVARQGENWYAQAQLALLQPADGGPAAALERLRHARRLNPREPAIAAALAAIRRREPVPAAVAERLAAAAVPGPLGRHPVDCRPVLGLGVGCREGVGR
jgi:tetratricopeptide (TPR) repeat protein